MCGSWVSNVTVAQWQCPLWTPNVPPMRRSTERCAGTSLSRKKITPEEESCFSSIIFQLSNLLEYCKTVVIKKPYIVVELFFHQLSFLHHSIIQNERNIHPNKRRHSFFLSGGETQVPTSAWRLETVRLQNPFCGFWRKFPNFAQIGFLNRCLFSVLNWGVLNTSLFHPLEDLSDSLPLRPSLPMWGFLAGWAIAT